VSDVGLELVGVAVPEVGGLQRLALPFPWGEVRVAFGGPGLDEHPVVGVCEAGDDDELAGGLDSVEAVDADSFAGGRLVGVGDVTA
jgi:hypothetical protein